MAAVAFWLLQDARGDPLYLLRSRQTSEAGLLCAHLYKVRAHAFERVSLSSGGKSWRDSDRDAALRITHLFYQVSEQGARHVPPCHLPGRQYLFRVRGGFAVCTFMVFTEQGTVQSGIRTHVRGVWTRCFTT